MWKANETMAYSLMDLISIQNYANHVFIKIHISRIQVWGNNLLINQRKEHRSVQGDNCGRGQTLDSGPQWKLHRPWIESLSPTTFVTLYCELQLCFWWMSGSWPTSSSPPTIVKNLTRSGPARRGTPPRGPIRSRRRGPCRAGRRAGRAARGRAQTSDSGSPSCGCCNGILLRLYTSYNVIIILRVIKDTVKVVLLSYFTITLLIY